MDTISLVGPPHRQGLRHLPQHQKSHRPVFLSVQPVCASHTIRPYSLKYIYSPPPPTPTQATMQACRRSLSSTSPLLHRNASCFPPRIPNNDLRVFLLPRFQSTAPSSIESALTNAINAPTATLPAPLELPKKESGMNTFMYLLKTGKGYVCVKKIPPPQFPSGIGSTLIYSN